MDSLDSWCNFFNELVDGWYAAQNESFLPEPTPDSIFVGRPYEKWGEIEEAARPMYEMMYSMVPPLMTEENIQVERTNMASYYPGGPAQDFYNVKAVSEKIENLGGESFYPGANVTYAIKHSKKGSSTDRCMIYFHGGGAVAGSPELNGSFINRYAVEADVHIFAVKYGLGPERKAPGGILDGYGVTKQIVQQAWQFGCNPNKIGIFGESGGGYITAGVGMLLGQEEDMRGKVRFQIQQIPQIGNLWFREPFPEKDLNKEEIGVRFYIQSMYKLLGCDSKESFTDPFCFPNEMGDKLASLVPPVVITTAEFDFLQYNAKEGAELYRRNGNLLDFGSYGGAFHGHYFIYELKQTDVWFKDFARLCNKYLQ